MNPRLRSLLVHAGVLLMYLLAAFTIEGSFLPLASDYVYDTRFLHPNHVDKNNELTASRAAPLSGLLYEITGVVGSEDTGIREHGAPSRNFLPHLLLRALSGPIPEIPAYNLLHLASWLLAGMALFWLARQLGASVAASAVGGLMLLLSETFREILRYSSLDFCMIFWLPLLCVVLLRAARPGRRRDLVIAAMVVVGLAATNYYYLFTGAALGVTLLGWSLLDSSSDDRWRRTGRLLMAGALGGAIAAPSLFSVISNLEHDRTIPWTHVLSDVLNGATPMPLLERIRGSQTVMLRWSLVLLGLGAAGIILRWNDPVGRARRYLGGLVILMVGATLVLLSADQDLAELLNSMPLLWRMRKLETLWVLPLVLSCALAAGGLSDLAARLPPRWAAVVLATGLAVTIGLGWHTDRTMAKMNQRYPEFHVPAAVVKEISSSPPGTRFVVLGTAKMPLAAGLVPLTIASMTQRPYLPVESSRASMDGMPSVHQASSQEGRSHEAGSFKVVLEEECPIVLLWHLAHPPGFPVLTVSEDLIRVLDLQVRFTAGRWSVAHPRVCESKFTTKSLIE